MTIEQWAEYVALGASLVIFDLDGTIVEPVSGGEFREKGKPDDWQYIGEHQEQVHALRRAGVACAIATNQGGVAFGFFDPVELLYEIYRAAQQVGIHSTSVFYCYMHPKATINRYRGESPDRKPGPGMLLKAFEMERLAQPDLTKEQCLMVGDRDEDRLAAEAAGMDFQWANIFFAIMK